jgi:hypothetical protein
MEEILYNTMGVSNRICFHRNIVTDLFNNPLIRNRCSAAEWIVNVSIFSLYFSFVFLITSFSRLFQSILRIFVIQRSKLWIIF